MRVDDAAKHAALAGLSRCYLAYLDCTRKGGTEKRSIAAAFTNGDTDFLMVGRNGVFYDRDGSDWDATITKVIENPISIRQAFFSPYKKLVRLIESQIEKFAAAKDKASDATVAAGVPSAGAAPAAASGFDIAKFAGIFAAVGLALGALGSALALTLGAFLGLAWWQMPIAVAGILLVISGPAMLLAALKLRQRSLGPLLEANGWAINTRARINIPFGTTLTSLPELPPGSVRSMTDPYGDKSSRWPKILLLAAVVGGAAYVLWDRGILAQLFELGG